MSNPSPLPSSRHPFLELCQESDLLDIFVTPNGTGGCFPAGVSAKVLTGSSRVYSLMLRHGLRGDDSAETVRDALWLAVDGEASPFKGADTDYDAALASVPAADRPDVIDAIQRLSEIQGAASRVVGQFIGFAQGHVYSLLNGLAAQAGTVYPEGSVPRTWEDALELFARLCRAPGLQGVRLAAASGGLSLVDASAVAVDSATGATHEVSVVWSGWDLGLPTRVVTFDGSSVPLESDEGGFEGLVEAAPRGSREGLSGLLSRLVRMSDLAGQVVLGHHLAADDSSAGGLGVDSGGVEALAALNGLALLHSGH